MGTQAGHLGPTPERVRLAREAANLRATGMTFKKISEGLNVSPSYAAELVYDPDGSKARARKDSYGGTCVVCGTRTSGSNGRAKTPDTCYTCRKNAGPTKWTEEAVLEKLAEWRDSHPGVLPNSTLWLRNQQDATVNVTTILSRFGTWRAAWAMVGVTIPERGRYYRDDEWRRRKGDQQRKPASDYDHVFKLAEQHPDWTLSEIADHAGLSSSRVGQVINQYRPDLRRRRGRRPLT